MDKALVKAALRELARHEKDFGKKIPPRLKDFWKTGEAFQYEGLSIPSATLPDYEDKASFQLALAAPSWSAQTNYAGLDDGVEGPRGDWKHCGECVPIFHVSSSHYIAVKLDRKCSVGFYNQEHYEDHGDGFNRGLFMLAPSLDEFLATLKTVKRPTFTTLVPGESWSGDDDDDDGD
jgi:hypothetical protein